MSERIPAQVEHVSVFIADELEARGWTHERLAVEMTKKELATNQLTVGLLLDVQDPGMILDKETAHKLANAFGVSQDLFLNLDAAWRKAMLRAVTSTTPDLAH